MFPPFYPYAPQPRRHHHYRGFMPGMPPQYAPWMMPPPPPYPYRSSSSSSSSSSDSECEKQYRRRCRHGPCGPHAWIPYHAPCTANSNQENHVFPPPCEGEGQPGCQRPFDRRCRRQMLQYMIEQSPEFVALKQRVEILEQKVANCTCGACYQQETKQTE